MTTTIPFAQDLIDALPAVQAGAIRITLTADAGWAAADVHTPDTPGPRRVDRVAAAADTPGQIAEAVIARIRPEEAHATMWRHSSLDIDVTRLDGEDAEAAGLAETAAVAWYTLAPHGAPGRPACVAVTCTPHGGVEACGYYRRGMEAGEPEKLPAPSPGDDIAELLGDLILRDSVAH